MKKVTTILLALLAGVAVYAEEFKEIAPLEQRIKLNAQPVKNNQMENQLFPKPEKLETKVENGIDKKVEKNIGTKVKSQIEKGAQKTEFAVNEVKTQVAEPEKVILQNKVVDTQDVMTKDKIDGRVLDLEQKRMFGGLAYANNEDKPYTGTFALFLGDFIEYSETFVNGVLEGPKTWYSESGNIVLQEYYKNNKVEGEQKAYYENGNLKSVVDYKGSRVMGMVAYSPDGKVLHKDDFKNGNGKWKYFWSNGKILEEGQYKNWVKDGIWKKYRENGELDTVTEYKNGRVVEETWH